MGEKVRVIDPIARVLECRHAGSRVDIGTDGHDPFELRKGSPDLAGEFQCQVPAHGISYDPESRQSIAIDEFFDHGIEIMAQTTVIERRG